MKFSGRELQILDKKMMQKLSCQEVPEPLFPYSIADLNNDFSKAKNIIFTGEFCTGAEVAFREEVLKGSANVQTSIIPETELVICGKFPDWILVEDARQNGIKIIFTDKAGESFSRMATKLIKNGTDFPLEELMEV